MMYNYELHLAVRAPLACPCEQPVCININIRHIFFLVDIRHKPTENDRIMYEWLLEQNIPFTIIANKTDICPSFELPEIYKNYPIIKISAKTLQGINDLRNHLKDCAGYKNTSEGLFSARRRHLQSIESAQIHLQKALDFISLRQDIELSAEEMNEAQQNLNEILGRFTSDDLLTEIFNTFCIGK